jgi:hypothetical protein
MDVAPALSARRLVDYVAVCGYDHARKAAASDEASSSANRNDAFACNGKILQRFPSRDWKDVPFIGESGEERRAAAVTRSPCVVNAV